MPNGKYYVLVPAISPQYEKCKKDYDALTEESFNQLFDRKLSCQRNLNSQCNKKESVMPAKAGMTDLKNVQ